MHSEFITDENVVRKTGWSGWSAGGTRIWSQRNRRKDHSRKICKGKWASVFWNLLRYADGCNELGEKCMGFADAQSTEMDPENQSCRN